MKLLKQFPFLYNLYIHILNFLILYNDIFVLIYFIILIKFLHILFYFFFFKADTIERTVKIKNTIVIGLVYKKLYDPSYIKTAFLKLVSSIGPKITAKTIGELGIFIFDIIYPIIPKIKVTPTSNKLLFIEYDPIVERINIAGIIKVLGISTILL